MTTRKEDKLRPYRVDYFDIEEMKENDLALVRSVVVRAVTADEAIYEVLERPEFWTTDYPSLIIIRSYRFYQTLGPRVKVVYKAVEDLFTANKAIQVMEQVESYRAKKAGSLSAPVPVIVPAPPAATEAAPTSGPDSPATKAVVADLQGMISHDAHEQTMDTFVPTNVPDGKRFPDPTNEPLTAPVPVAPVAAPPTPPPNQALPPASVKLPMPLGVKIAIFSIATAAAILIVLAILRCGH